jgi:hypothetical protein
MNLRFFSFSNLILINHEFHLRQLRGRRLPRPDLFSERTLWRVRN